MALAASACLMTHPANYSGKGSSLDPLFGSRVCAPCLTQGDLLPPITCKDRIRLQGANLVLGKQVRAGDFSEMFFPRSHSSGRGESQSASQA